MKKFLLIGLLALMGLGLNSCVTSSSDNEPWAKKHTLTLDLTVMQPDWAFDNGSQQFYYHFDVPEITANVYNYGNWTICREFNSGTKDAYQVALPMSSFMVEDVTYDDGTTGTVYYTQHIDYRVGIGYVEVQLTNSDYFYPSTNPEDMLFRLQLIY